MTRNSGTPKKKLLLQRGVQGVRDGRRLVCVILSFGVACSTSYAYGVDLRPLDVQLTQFKSTPRFISSSEWKYLSSLTDCPEQGSGGQWPAVRLAVPVERYRKEVHATTDFTRVITFSLPQDVTLPGFARGLVVRKVVCGSRGIAVLYSDVFGGGSNFVLNRFDRHLNLVGADMFSLPVTMHLENWRGGAGKEVGRFSESPNGFALVVLDVSKNMDRRINAAEHVAIAQYEFLVSKRPETLMGYADRPGPLLTPDFVSSNPLQVMPGVFVPGDIQRHEVDIGNWRGAASVHLAVVDHPVYLRLRARHPVDWTVTVASGARLAIIHLSGPPPQSVTGISKEVVVLRFARQGGSQQEDTARSVLDAHTKSASSDQRVPHYKTNEVILVDGKIGAKAREASVILHPGMRSDVPGDVQSLVANCASLNSQDERIECYRLRARVLQGKHP